MKIRRGIIISMEALNIRKNKLPLVFGIFFGLFAGIFAALFNNLRRN